MFYEADFTGKKGLFNTKQEKEVELLLAVNFLSRSPNVSAVNTYIKTLMAFDICPKVCWVRALPIVLNLFFIYY
jgi:hypothetical protein